MERSFVHGGIIFTLRGGRCCRNLIGRASGSERRLSSSRLEGGVKGVALVVIRVFIFRHGDSQYWKVILQFGL